jgi:hypothetical protein
LPIIPNHLAEKRYVTVILRLLLDRRGRLINGELVDVESTLEDRFIGWRGLTRAVRGWLTRQERDSASDDA